MNKNHTCTLSTAVSCQSITATCLKRAIFGLAVAATLASFTSSANATNINWNGTEAAMSRTGAHAASKTEERKVYTMAVFPGAESSQFGYFEMMDRFLPFAEYLSAETGADVRIVPIRIPSMAMSSLDKGHYDLFFGPPVFAAKAVEDAQFAPVAREEENIKAAFVVMNDSPLKSLRDLKPNDTIATPPANLLLSILTKETLAAKGKNANQAIPLSINQNALLTALETGTHSVAALRDKAARKLLSEHPGKYRIIDESVAAPGFSVVANPAVNPEFRAKLFAAVMKLQHSPRTQPMEAEAWRGLNVAKFVQSRPDDFYALAKTMARWEPKQAEHKAEAPQLFQPASAAQRMASLQ